MDMVAVLPGMLSPRAFLTELLVLSRGVDEVRSVKVWIKVSAAGL